MRGLILALAMVVLPGCVSDGSPLPTYGDTRPIEPEYRPLETLSERPDLVLPSSAITTVGATAYVLDLDDFMARHPAGSPTYRSKMRHEQEHARRELAHGVLSWMARYLTEADFMWTEEQRGWYYEIITLRDAGLFVNVDGIAEILYRYKTATGAHMVGREEAKLWIRSVLSGQWTLPQ